MQTLESLGATVSDVALPSLHDFAAAGWLIGVNPHKGQAVFAAVAAGPGLAWGAAAIEI